MGYGNFGGARPQGTPVKTPWGTRYKGGVTPQEWDAQGGYNLPRMRGAAYQALQEGQGSNAAERQAVGAYNAFDPGAAFAQYEQGSLGQTKRSLAQALADLADQEVGGGRLHTGFYDEDRGKVATDIYQQHDERMRQAALQAAGMQEGHLGNAAQLATGLRDRYLGLVGDSYNRLYAEEQNKPRGGWLGNALGGIVGAAAGSFLGPFGAAAGKKLAGKVF